MFGIISGDVKLLFDVVTKVGMDRGDGLVLGIHLLAGEYCQSVSGLEKKRVFGFNLLVFIQINTQHSQGRACTVVHKMFDLCGVCGA